MENGLPFVTLGGVQMPIRLPAPFALRLDLFHAAGRNSRRGCVAALGLSWGGDEPLRTTIRRFGDDDLLAYGGAVTDELIGRGYSWSEIRDAGTTVWALIAESVTPMLEMPTPAEVQTAEDFTGAPAGAGTG